MEENEKKTCPFCGESIEQNATVCPFCDEDLTNKEENSDNIDNEDNKEQDNKTNTIQLPLKNKKFCNKNIILTILGLVTVICLFFLLSFKYKIENTTNGVYRINQITGETKLLQGSQMIELNKVRNISELEKKQLSQFKELNSQQVSGKNITCNLKYLWRDGKLFYNFMASPYDGDLKKAEDNYGRFYIVLKDKNDFTIESIPVYISSMQKIVDNNGKPMELQVNDSKEITYDNMKLIDHWELNWKID